MKTILLSRIAIAVAVAFGATAATTSACHAQAWIGQIAGDVAAQQEQAAQEQACLAGAPADPDAVQRARSRIEKAMVAFFDLTSSATPREIRGAFTSDKNDIRYKDVSGEVAFDQLGARLDTPAPQRTLVAMVVSGDGLTAQAIWSVAPADGNDIAYYAGDFVNEGWIGGWRIWHLDALPASQMPDVPPAYCHFNTDQSF
jgi:hypothetical protein